MSSRTIPTWRRLAWAAWRPPSDPQFYGELDIDAAALLAYIDRIRRRAERD